MLYSRNAKTYHIGAVYYSDEVLPYRNSQLIYVADRSAYHHTAEAYEFTLAASVNRATPYAGKCTTYRNASMWDADAPATRASGELLYCNGLEAYASGQKA